MKDEVSAPSTALLRRLLRDDSAAWSELVRTYSGFLLAVTRKTFGSYGVRPSNQDVEDAVSDVWKNLLENDRKVLRLCLERNNFLQTLQVLARHRAVDIMRKRSQRTTALSGHEPERPTEAPEPEMSLSPKALTEAVKALTPRERTLIQLFFLKEKKYREISELTGIPQNSIGPTLARALARLRKAIEP